MARRSAACAVCGRLVTMEVSDTGVGVIPPHRHKGKDCAGGEKVARFHEALTDAQLLAKIRAELEEKRGLRNVAPIPVIVELPVTADDLNKRAMDAAFARP